MNINGEELKKYLYEILNNNRNASEEELSLEINKLFSKLFEDNDKEFELIDTENEIPDELRELVLDALKNSSSIDYAIKERENEKRLIEDSFNVVKTNYQTASIDRVTNLLTLKYLIINVKLSKIKLYIMQEEGYKLFNELENRLKDNLEEYKNLKSILKLIKNAIKRLEEIEAIMCLSELNELLSQIIEKENLILKYSADLATKYSIRLNGIDVTSNNKMESELEKLDEDILNSIKTLNLR